MKEIDNYLGFEYWIDARAPYPAALQELNLLKYEHKIINCNFRDSLFLGCELTDEAAGHIVNTGGMVIANRRDKLFKVHKAHLYTVDELFKGFDVNKAAGFTATYDYKIYEEYVKNGMERPNSIVTSLTRRLHDHSITDALADMIVGKKVVAIMGGHSMERGNPYYASVARIARTLTQMGFLMVSGGGPGAMEATHLGAYFAARPLQDLHDAIDTIKIRPANAPVGKEYADSDWLHRAWRIRQKYPIPAGKFAECTSIGIPTWLYGHEPPTAFATHIAKYFSNSVREDGLVTIANYGIVFAPGSAGTTQEIFQDATQNHYAPYNTHPNKKYISPMILLGKEHWTRKRPIWDVLQKVSEDKPYGKLLFLTDDEQKIINIITTYKPKDFAYPKSIV